MLEDAADGPYVGDGVVLEGHLDQVLLVLEVVEDGLGLLCIDHAVFCDVAQCSYRIDLLIK